MASLKKAWAIIVRLFTAIFGSISYRPPAFARFLGRKTATGFNFLLTPIKNYREKKPAHFNRIAGLAPIVIGFIIGGAIWYNSLPKPTLVEVTIYKPGLTPLEKDAIPDILEIHFESSVARLEDVDKKIVTGIKMKPEFQGEFKWTEDDRIVFTPAEGWPVDQEFTIKFEKSLFPGHIHLKKYETSFKTEPFGMSISSSEFYIDPKNENIKQVIATVTFTHPVEPGTFESKISLHPEMLSSNETGFDDRHYKMTVSYDDYFGKAYLISEPLAIPRNDVKMFLAINKRVQSAFKGNKTDKTESVAITVPGITSYVRILSVDQEIIRNDDYKMEQVLVISSKGKASVESLIKNLEIWQLPKDLPASPGTKFQKNMHWNSVKIIGPRVLKNAKKVTISPIPAENKYSGINSFKIKLPPKSYLYVKLKKGTPFFGKYILSTDYEVIKRIKNFPTQVEIMHEGMLLSRSGDRKVSIITQGIKGVRFKVGRVMPNQINHLVTQTNGNLSKIRFQNYKFNEDNIVENFIEKVSLLQQPPDEANFLSFDLGRYLKSPVTGKSKKGIFFLEVQEWNPEKDYVTGKSDKRLILVSDMGVITKDGADKSHNLFIQSVSTGKPGFRRKSSSAGEKWNPRTISL